MNITPEKRRRIYILLAASVTVGLLLIGFGPPEAKDVGYFLVFVWIVPGSLALLYFAKPRQRVVAALPTFLSKSPFVPHVHTRISFSDPQRSNARADEQDMLHCIFVVDSEGFTVRLPMDNPASAVECEAEFLFPGKALVRMNPGTRFAVLVDGSTRGTGEVLAQVNCA
ncbi:MAG TPA: hypothetical protein VF522_02405 [Ramlibacter sp.]|uniref:hypothetical protein n=1 Tax=Ramlibacter sp. TaxID=1917967 RepID=UPI002ED33E54